MTTSWPFEQSYRHMQPRHDSEPAAKTLPLGDCSLTVDAKGGLARVTLVQRFRNPHAEPLAVSYKLPLPEDAAVSDFGFTVGDTVVRGVVQKRAEARETYERALADGRSGALLEQERASLFSQEIGNIPAGAELEVRVVLDQPLVWIADASDQGSWEWRFPLAAAPRYLGGPELGADSANFASTGTSARASLALAVRDALERSPESPSHPLSHREGHTQFGSGNRVGLDRDVVVRWSVATARFASSLDVRGEGTRAFGLLTVIPPARARAPLAVPRDLTLLLDTSGSMQGEPLEQEKRLALALIDALGDADTLELLEFSNQTRAFEKKPAPATAERKARASRWVQALQASGGTEMVSGVRTAMRELRADSQRQIVLITDGLVGFEQQLVSTVLQHLPASARLHCVGVGSAVNRSLVAPIARAGRGIEALVGLGEDAERAARRVLDRSQRPLLVDLTVEGSAVLGTVPTRLPDVFANAPLRLAVELNPAGGEILVRGRTLDGPFVERVRCDRVEAGEGNPAVAKLFAREQVEEYEMQLSGGGAEHALNAAIERIALEQQIASRLTSWVAVTEARTVDPRDPSRHVVQPQALAFSASAEGLGLRAPASDLFGSSGSMAMAAPPQDAPAPIRARRMASLGAPPRPGAGAPPSPASSRHTGAPPPAADAPVFAAPPPPPAPAAPSANRSLPARALERVKRALGKGEAAPRETHELGGGDGAPHEGAHALAARIVQMDDEGLTLELISTGFTFDANDASCTILLDDGSTLEPQVVLEQSTRSGFVAAGLRIRLTLRHPARRGVALRSARIELDSLVFVAMP